MIHSLLFYIFFRCVRVLSICQRLSTDSMMTVIQRKGEAEDREAGDRWEVVFIKSNHYTIKHSLCCYPPTRLFRLLTIRVLLLCGLCNELNNHAMRKACNFIDLRHIHTTSVCQYTTRVFPGCITKRISLDSWQTDRNLGIAP